MKLIRYGPLSCLHRDLLDAADQRIVEDIALTNAKLRHASPFAQNVRGIVGDCCTGPCQMHVIALCNDESHGSEKSTHLA